MTKPSMSLIDTPSNKNAKKKGRLNPTPLRQVGITDEFWAPKLAVLSSVTVNDGFDKFERRRRLCQL